MTASFPAVLYGPLHFRLIDMDKTTALQHAMGDMYAAYRPIIS